MHSLYKGVYATELEPSEFSVGQNYPNPFKEKTVIKYCVAYKSKVQIIVYDSEGKLIEKLVDEEKKPGTYEVEFYSLIDHSGKSEKLLDGYYFYQMIAGDYSSEKKWLCINNLLRSNKMKTFLRTLFFFLLTSQICFGQVDWTKYPSNPIGLLNGAPGSWNRNVCEASILYNADSSRYEMWFAGTAGNPVFPYRIGYAKSIDGISWELHPVPVLTPTSGTWDQYSIQLPFVILENGQYKMWYSSSPTSDYNHCKIGYATSPDGINWTKLPNPIFEPGTDPWEAGGVMSCYVMPVSGGYKIWYSGFTTALTNGKVYIGYATSVDGISWQRDTINNPVLEPGVAGLWDGKWVWYPQVLFIDNMYYMYYAGTNIGYWSTVEVGLATSMDGITQWTKHPQNPVLSPSPGMWDGEKVEASSVKLIGDSLLMWYSGNGSFLQMGIAKSLFEPVSVEQDRTQATAFILLQNYPNPFNPRTKIKYSIPQTSQVQIKVFDVLGNEIETLVNEEKPAGTYELTWNAANLPSGIYFYRIQAGSFVETRKMLLLK